MKAFLVFTYSIFAYAIGMGGLVLFILFQADWLLPITVNSGTSVPVLDGFLVNLSLLLLWGVQHSVMARPAFKARLTKWIPDAAERSTYTLASGLCLLAIIVWWQGNTAVVWQAAGLELPLRIISIAGWGLTVWATFQIDHFDLFGLKKPFYLITGRVPKRKDFVTPFLYRQMRHPIQTGILIGMWSQAFMSMGQLLLSTGMTIYVFVGLWYEERDLVNDFGDRYRLYMQQVPRLFPRPGKRIQGKQSSEV
jgi:protein-S-isoprenylcysteine O-methyltransferase Ste14